MKSKTRKPSSSPDLGERLSMTEWRKHYVSTVTAEDDVWPQRESGTNLGRIFVLLLLLHVFIIGAVVLYNIVAPKAPLASRTDGKPQTINKPVAKTETASTAAKAVTAAPVAKAAETTAAPKPPAAKLDPPPASKPAAPKPAENLLTYDVKSGDNVPGIASALGVNAEDLVKLNNLDSSELYPGRKLVYRNPAAPTPAPAVPAGSTAPKLQPAILNTASTAPKPKAEPLKLVVPSKEKEKTEDSLPKVAVKVSVPDASPDEVPHAVPIKSMPVEDQLPAAKPKVKSHTDDPPAAKPKSENKTKNDDKKKSAKSDKSETKTASKSDKEKISKSEKGSGKKTHVVGPHETLYSISRKFGVSLSALQKANNIKDPTLLRDGSKLVIPSKN
jgi:LysM repeat protein